MAILEVISQQGFEVGDPSFSDSQYAHPHSVRVMEGGSAAYASEIPYGTLAQRTAPAARQGSRIMRALVKDGDSAPFGSTLRAEIQYPNVPTSGSVITWEGFSIYFPENIEQRAGPVGGSSSAFRITGQWHEAVGSPTFRIDTSTRMDGEVRITRKVGGSAEAQHDLIAPLESLKGKWVDFVTTAKWTTASDGWFIMWARIEGADWVQVSRTAWESGIKTLDGGGSVSYFKHGIYGSIGGLLYFDWHKRIRVSDAADYFADVQTPGTPPIGGGGSDPDPLPVNADPLLVSVVPRGGNYADTASTTFTIPNVQVEGSRSLVVAAMARIPAAATVVSVAWNGDPMNIVWQYESTDQSPSALAVLAELHDVDEGVGDVVFTFSENYEAVSGVASEVWDIGAAVDSEIASGVSALPDSGGLDTDAFNAFLLGYVFVGGTEADTVPEIGGIMTRRGQRQGDVSEPLANTTTNEGYGSQVIGGTREVLARLPSTSRVWVAALTVFPLQPQEYDEAIKRYNSLHWAIPLT